MFSAAYAFIAFLLFHPSFWIGYAICVLFPIPFLNSAILSLWSKFGTQLMTWFGHEEKTATASVETSVETAVVKAVSADVPAVVAAVVVTPTATSTTAAAPAATVTPTV